MIARRPSPDAGAQLAQAKRVYSALISRMLARDPSPSLPAEIERARLDVDQAHRALGEGKAGPEGRP